MIEHIGTMSCDVTLNGWVDCWQMMAEVYTAGHLTCAMVIAQTLVPTIGVAKVKFSMATGTATACYGLKREIDTLFFPIDQACRYSQKMCSSI